MVQSDLNRSLIITLIFCAATACGGKPDSGNPNPDSGVPVMPAAALVKLENSGEIPRLDRSDTLAGPDTNHNGVRDDIEAYINATFKDPGQHAAVMQEARTVQSAILVDVTDPDATRAVSRSIMRSTHCMSSRFAHDQGALAPMVIGNQIEAMTANTKKRMKAYLAFNKSQDGTVASMPEGDTCE